ncbi:MAG: hypothetical protein ACRD0J_03610 [Acidimicrobiales bacterium]
MRRPIALAATTAASFVAMEPATYAAHRWVMHGVGWALHRSHHQASLKALEANDAFPVMFASATVVLMAAGAGRSSLRPLQAVGAGVTLYGAAYGFVHDVYIHSRLGTVPRVGLLERLRQAHRIHHLFQGEPYGMLFPIVPAELRARVALAGPEPAGADFMARGRGRAA